jgi:hypothetical protein
VPTRRHWLLGPTPQVVLALIALAAGYQVAVSAGVDLPQFDASSKLARVGDDLSLALLSSWVFNLLAIVLPGLRKRIWLATWLDGRYLDFKRSLISIYLSILDFDREDEDVEPLLDPLRFAEFCENRYSDDQSNWHAIHNRLYEWGLPKIRLRCEIFLRECELAIGSVGQLSEPSTKLMSRVRYIAFQARDAEPEYVDIKNLMNTLFALHCPWEVLDGEKFVDRPREQIKRM